MTKKISTARPAAKNPIIIKRADAKKPRVKLTGPGVTGKGASTDTNQTPQT